MRWLAAVGSGLKTPRYLPDHEARFGNVPSLDGLRALSITAVMLSHLAIPQVPGGHGVFLFFIISGFLITRLLFAEMKTDGKIGLGQFYMRRFFRLYPALIAFCLIVPTAYYIKDGFLDISEPLSVLFYFNNYLVADRSISGIPFQIEPIKIFWSLSVEEHFYLLFPVIFIMARSAKQIAIIAALACVLALAIRVSYANFYPDLVNTHYMYMRTEFRFDAVAFGVFLAALCQIPSARPFLIILAHPVSFISALLVGLVAIAIGDDYFANVWRYALLGPAIVVAMAGLLFSARYSVFQFLLNLPIANWIGRLSYSLYIWHLPAQALAWSLTTGIAAIGLSVLLSVGAAAASFYGIERPMNRFRRRFGSRALS